MYSGESFTPRRVQWCGGAEGAGGSVVVGLHVAMEVARLREPEVADLAAVGFLAAVDPLVLGEGGGVGEALAAVVAPVWPLAGVGSEVGSHGRALGEPLLADGAAERFFSAVRAHVGSQVGGLGEGFGADFASVGFFPTVGPHVRLEGGGAGIALAADLADVVPRLVWLLPRLGTGGFLTVHVGHAGTVGHCAVEVSHVRDETDRLDVGRVLRIHAAGRGRSLIHGGGGVDSLTRGVAALPEGRYQVRSVVLSDDESRSGGGRDDGGRRRRDAGAGFGVEGEEGIHGYLLILSLHSWPVRINTDRRGIVSTAMNSNKNGQGSHTASWHLSGHALAWKSVKYILKPRVSGFKGSTTSYVLETVL